MKILPYDMDGKLYYCEVLVYAFEPSGRRIYKGNPYQSRENDHLKATKVLQTVLKRLTVDLSETNDLVFEATIVFRVKADNDNGYMWVMDRVDQDGTCQREYASTSKFLGLLKASN